MSSSTVTPSSPLTGSCFCGAIKYELSAPPVLRAYCHCTKCQRMTGMFLFHIPYCTSACSQRFCVQVARSFILCTSPPLPSRGSMMLLLTRSSNLSNPGRLALAVARAVSLSLRTTRRQTKLACGVRTFPATNLGVCCVGTKCDLQHIYFMGHGYWM